jgi:hypothetical protein
MGWTDGFDDTASEQSSRSVRSTGSRRSAPRYRAVNKGGADEQLFGKEGNSKWAAARAAPKPVAYVSRSELERIKRSTVIKTQTDIDRENEMKEERKGRKQKAAKDRKERMREKAERAKARSLRSDTELQEEAERLVLLNKAADLRSEDNDAVKLLNTLGQRAAAFTVREQQLAERENRLKRELDYEKRMEKVMEIERLKDIRRRDEEEKIKREKRYADREILQQQMRERKAQRMRKIKEIELEGEAMVRQLNRNKELEEQRVKQKLEVAKIKRAEIVKENQRAIEKKKLVIQQEIEEDEKVVAYQNMKARELSKREAEEAEKKQAAELLCAKLRAQQQRAMDNRSEIDGLRAKRYQEDRYRKERARELAEEEHKKATLVVMQEAREAQLKMREHNVAVEVRAQKEEYQDCLEQAWRAADREQKERESKKKAMEEHQAKLLEQIALKKRMRSESAQVKKEEGLALKKEFQMELAKLEHTRQELVKSYKRQGVKEKYLSELTKADIAKIQLR